MSNGLYLLLNDEDVPVARGSLMTPPDGAEIRVKVMDDGIDALSERKLVTLVGTFQNMPTLQGEVLQIRGDILRLRRVESKEDVREVLRVDVSFDSLIYPVDGAWSGRRKVQFIDLSCGGIAFFCEAEMERGEEFEVVIPVTPKPLLMRCRILRTKEKNGRSYYAAKFVDMCHDEEKLICEAVFGIQLSQQKKKSNGRRGEE